MPKTTPEQWEHWEHVPEGTNPRKYFWKDIMAPPFRPNQYIGPRMSQQQANHLRDAYRVGFLDRIAIARDVAAGLDPKVIENHDHAEARRLVLFAFYWVSQPTRQKPIDEWLDLFHQLGINLGKQNTGQQITLYRGASRDHPHGLSWSPYFVVGYSYAVRRPEGAVFAMTVDAKHLIHFTVAPSASGEPLEVIVDSRPHDLEIVWEPSTDLPGVNADHITLTDAEKDTAA